ncbi:unnamed protein product [Caenorhabditis bovis]|uniref:Uncharacterized protein n=1 Tax=Caenorhabditis bovis TaxID=2654633 RepID=A0A8S1E6R2_9PELO|nr:unnamed protein product [Caenorhabditis bovis]
MAARNYDNVPPHANNTVTISTTPQVRLASTGQMRPISMPMRPQPVPIRKVHHDGNMAASTSTAYSTMHTTNIKEEPDNLDFQTASSSGALLAGPSGSTINSFQQYQRGTAAQTTSNLHNNGVSSSGTAMDQPAPVNLASKVAEVFLTAGHAFQKLGDLTLQLHTTTDSDESKWSDKEVDSLRDALTRFAHELDQISSCVASRTTKHIKNDIKRRHLIDESNQQVKRMAMGAGGSGMGGTATYTTIGSTINSPSGIGSIHAVPLAQKRVAIQPTGKVVATRAVIPSRYTINTGSTSNQNGSSSGMPLLQQQTTHTLTAQPSGSQGRLTARVAVQPGTVIGVGPPKRVLPPKPASGALVYEANE